MTNLSNSNTSSNSTNHPKYDPNSFYHLTIGFNAGDVVLCPSIGNDSYTLQPNDIPCDDVMVTIPIKGFRHRFYKDGRIYKNSPLPSLFHDTPANRQAVKSLYGMTVLTLIPCDTATPCQQTPTTITPLQFEDYTFPIAEGLSQLGVVLTLSNDYATPEQIRTTLELSLKLVNEMTADLRATIDTLYNQNKVDGSDSDSKGAYHE